MEAKPFSLQSPEKVAETYGGNKQKIAQAVQMGVIDPTSGLLAGMFIDRMRSAQVMEQAPQRTVAQQVFAPPAPAARPVGLGAIAPQGGGAPAPMGQPPVGVAMGGLTELPASRDGGLTTLPLPDDMYNEESFAGGGIVAFADGGQYDPKTTEEMQAYKQTLMLQMRTGTSAERQQAAAELRRMGSYTFPLPPPDAAANRLIGVYAAATDQNATPEQRAEARKQIYALSTPTAASTAAPTAALPAFDVAGTTPAATVVPRAPVRRAPATTPPPTSTGTTPDYMDLLKQTAVPTEAELAKKVEDYAGAPPKLALRTAEEKEKQKNEDLWSSLAQIGFGMAAGESPNALVNIGKAASAAIPGMQEAIKQRRADDKEDLKQELAYEMSKWGLKKDAFAKAMDRVDNMTKDNLARATAAAGIVSREKEAALNRDVQREQIAVQREVGLKPTDMERYLRGTPAEKAAILAYERSRSMYSSPLGVMTKVDAAEAKVKSDPRYKMLGILSPTSPKYQALNTQLQAEIEALRKRYEQLGIANQPADAADTGGTKTIDYGSLK